MKNLILLFALVITTLSFSQDHQVKIKGLVTAGQFTSLAMDEVNFQFAMSSSRGKGGSGPVMHYSVIKKHDGNSGRIENAIQTKKVFKEVQIWVKQSAGNILKYKLSNATITDYSATFKKGKVAQESFVINFQSRAKL